MYSKEILETKSVVELREIAKDLKIEGVSKLKKDDLKTVIFTPSFSTSISEIKSSASIFFVSSVNGNSIM